MSATFFTVTTKGITAQDAFQTIVDEYRITYGSNPYSGNISTKTSFKMVTPRKGETPDQVIDRMINVLDKWGPCACIEIAPPKIQPLAVKVAHNKPELVFKNQYVVYKNVKQVGSFDTKKEALKAIKGTPQYYPAEYTIKVEKKPCKNNLVATVTVEPNKKTQLGKYLFFGWAPS